MKRVLLVFVALVMLFVLAGCDEELPLASTITVEEADNYLSQQMAKIKGYVSYNETHPKGEVEMASAGNMFEYDLPSIDKYPLLVEGAADVNVEIWVPSMSGTSGIVDYFVEIAKQFNQTNAMLGEKTVAVSIRTMEPSLADEYLYYNSYIPDALIAENTLWGKLQQADGCNVIEVLSRTVGNVDGIILTAQKQDELKNAYKELTIKTIAKANNSGELKLGYNDPFQNPASLNFVISMLSSFDKYNPVSIEATEDFVEFQNAVASVPYTTLQMKQAITTGVLDALVIDYQSYKTSEDLRDYMFIPFGIRHDNPLYTFETVSAEMQDALNLFAKYCVSEDAKTVAKNYNFNENEDYVSNLPEYSGETLWSALNVWKSEKDATKPVVAVFVADRSGSMMGEKVENLKTSLKNASQYINTENAIGLITYSGDIRVNLPVSKFTHDQMSYFIGEVENIRAGGNTDTFDAVIVGIQELLKAKEKNPDCRMIMFVLSDGEWRNERYENIGVLCEKYGIQIHVIGYQANHSLMNKLAESCNGAILNADTDDISYLLKTFFNSQM